MRDEANDRAGRVRSFQAKLESLWKKEDKIKNKGGTQSKQASWTLVDGR